MLLSSFRRWMNTRTFSSPRDSQRNTKYDKRRTPLRLEVLEDRLVLSTYLVTTTNDAGLGSLRQAILDSDGNPGTNTIAFNISGSGVHTILPLSGLPDIMVPTILDGTTQPGYTNSPLIELSGTNAGPNTPGRRC